MRIELNSGGLDGLVSMAEFALSVDALDRKLDDMISSFQTVKKSIRNLEGGTGQLSGAVSSLDRRIFTEQQKKRNLQSFARRFDSFLSMAIRVDDNVANKVNRNREEFYRVNEHLRPSINIEDFIWDPFKSTLKVIGEVKDFIVETWTEHWDEIVSGVSAVLLIIGGVALVIVTVATGGAALIVIGGVALIGAGVGLGIALTNAMKDDGDIGFKEGFKGLACGFIAGAAIGACIYGAGLIANSISGIGGAIASQAAQGAGTSAAVDFFMQTVVDGSTVDGFGGYDIGQTIKEGLLGGLTSAAVGALFGLTGISSKVTDGIKGWLGQYSSFGETTLRIFSGIPKNAFEGATEGLLEYGVHELTGENDEDDSLINSMIDNALQSILFGVVGDSIDIKSINNNTVSSDPDVKATDVDVKATDVDVKATDVDVKVDSGESMADRIHRNIEESRIAREASKYNEAMFNIENSVGGSDANISISKDAMAQRIRENIELSRIARESSNFGTGELSYKEHKISSKGLRTLLHNRGLSDTQVDEVMQSFNKYSTSRTLPVSQDIPKTVTVKHTPVSGEAKWLYSSNGNASGIFVTNDLYVDNMTGISKLATPATNDMLMAERVLVFGDQINGTVAPQLSFTTDAIAGGYDNVIRIGGGTQTVTNGGLKTDAVKRMGEIRRLFDNATRVKLLVKIAE